MSSTVENPSAGRTASCPYTLASPGMSPRKSRTGGPASFKSTPPLLIAQTRASRRFRRFRLSVYPDTSGFDYLIIEDSSMVPYTYQGSHDTYLRYATTTP